MGSLRRRSRLLATTALLTGSLLGLAASGASGSAQAGTAKAQGSAKSHAASGTITYAELPTSPPDYIFPFENLTYFTVYNQQYFQYLMYRPLFWFGQGTQPVLNTSLSLAESPSYSNGDKTVTVTLKPYKWSNGESVTAQDVLFWMNMLKTEKQNWAGYVPGTIPDDVKNVVADGSTKLVFTLTGSVNSYWFTYNELSQITPLPVSWDVTSLSGAPGSGGCSKASFASVKVTAKGAPASASAKACAGVYDFLSEQAGYNPTSNSKVTNAFATYATSKIWSVVDGPWKLQTFNATGNDVLVPNTSYSGPVKPKVARFVEEYFTSDESEFDALVSGTIDYGYVPLTDITATAKSPTEPGANQSRLAGSFKLVPLYTWGNFYADVNENSSGDNGVVGKIFRQLYIRQAMETLIDQKLYIAKIFKGYAAPGYGPVPTVPSNKFLSSAEKSNPYPYSISAAKKLLSSHGWKVVPNGTDTCEQPKLCGAGIPKGAKLSFTEQYATGQQFFTEEVNAEDDAWKSAGISVKLDPASFDVTAGNAVACKPGPSCTWEIQNFGGWLYSPDYYPTGEDLFETGAIANADSYSNPQADSLIRATQTSASSAFFFKYENYVAKQLPSLWEPDNVYEMVEVSNKLSGATPLNPLLTITPESWSLK